MQNANGEKMILHRKDLTPNGVNPQQNNLFLAHIHNHNLERMQQMEQTYLLLQLVIKVNLKTRVNLLKKKS
jgi:hypothetical protein